MMETALVCLLASLALLWWGPMWFGFWVRNISQILGAPELWEMSMESLARLEAEHTPMVQGLRVHSVSASLVLVALGGNVGALLGNAEFWSWVFLRVVPVTPQPLRWWPYLPMIVGPMLIVWSAASALEAAR